MMSGPRSTQLAHCCAATFVTHAPRRAAASAAMLLALGIFFLFGARPVAAQAASVPPLVQPASEERHPGKIVLVELVTPDMAASKRFYGGMFDWTFTDVPAGKVLYSQAYHDGEPIAVLVQIEVPAGAHRQPAWISFLSTPDVDGAAKAASAAGAKVLLAPRTVAGRGREAILADPQGAVFGVIASSSGDPADVLADAGEWVWASLVTSDPDTDAAFYQALFNYEVYELPSTGAGMHLILASQDFSRASANSLPAHLPNARPHWVNFVRVADVDIAASKVKALGGTILVAPHADRHGGKIAVATDNSGAPFGLMEWSDDAQGAAEVSQ